MFPLSTFLSSDGRDKVELGRREKNITYLKELLDREALDYVVDRSQALAQKGSKYAAVDGEVWYLLVKRASAEWRTSKEFEGVTLPKKVTIYRHHLKR